MGLHSISGVYNGSSNYVTSTSPVLTQTVDLGSTTTVVGSSVNPSVSGESVTYTATVSVVVPAAGMPIGAVNFEDGGATITGCASDATDLRYRHVLNRICRGRDARDHGDLLPVTSNFAAQHRPS